MQVVVLVTIIAMATPVPPPAPQAPSRCPWTLGRCRNERDRTFKIWQLGSRFTCAANQLFRSSNEPSRWVSSCVGSNNWFSCYGVFTTNPLFVCVCVDCLYAYACVRVCACVCMRIRRYCCIYRRSC